MEASRVSGSQVRPFVHLHCHSHYSLLDGAGSIDRLIERAVSLGMNGLALTDHGNLHGALQFYTKAREAGLNPIVGYEAYIAPGSRRERKVRDGHPPSYHLTLLAQNERGFRNLIKLASKAYLEGFFYKPRIDRELLAEHHEGLICLSGCVSSEFSKSILRGTADEGDLEEARQIAEWFVRLFGDRYYIEIMNNGEPTQQLVMQGAVDIARQMGIPLVATSDCHYVTRDDHAIQDVLLCVNTGKFRADTDRLHMVGDYSLRSPDEMYAAFPGLEDAVARSQEIADGCHLELDLNRRHFPVFPVPEGKTPHGFLRELCEEGLRARYAGDEERCPGGELAPDVRERLDRELAVIHELGFDNYFLIVWDFVREAREQGIPATARGSGVGALVCYALYLSHVCPIRFGLLFERFLDPNRREAPDIDIDFCREWRGEIIRYVKAKYGEANVAQIGTIGTLQARQAIKDVGRVLGIPLARVSEITALVPIGPKVTIRSALEQSDDLRRRYEEDEAVRELLDTAMRLEGLARNVGTHAAGVVIADRPLTEYVPLGRVPGKEDIITQWPMEDVERAGLLKMDFLGLRNLTILRKAVALIEATTGERIDLERIPLDDKKTFELLCRGETKGVFQLESGGIRDLLQRMHPDSFHDIIATNALYRPGPLEGGMVDDYVDVKHGRKQPEYLHPILEEILAETHGVMVYQEQVMQILNRIGGIPLADAYTCIKAISKKKEEVIRVNQDRFIQGALAKNISRKKAEQLWEMIAKFAGYGFNKSHSTAYALVAYQTAYLKAHYPVPFMAALLSGDIPMRNFQTKDKLVEHMEDCRRMGIDVLPPDINRSEVEFAVEGNAIRFGLAAIRACGGQAPEAIVRARREGGPFRDLFDLCERVEPDTCNRTVLEMLIKSGACDGWGATRAQLLASIDKATRAASAAHKLRQRGQRGLFEDADDAAPEPVDWPDVPDLPQREQLLMERDALGFYLTAHPLADYEELLARFTTHTTAELASLPHRSGVVVGGMISAVKISQTKRPRPGSTHTRFASFDLEDRHDRVRCNLWPDAFALYGEAVQPDAIVVVRGVVDLRGGEEGPVNLTVHEIIPLDELENRCVVGLAVQLSETEHDDAKLQAVEEIVRYYPGKERLELDLRLRDGHRVLLRSRRHRIRVCTELIQRLEALLRHGAVRRLLQPIRPPQ